MGTAGATGAIVDAGGSVDVGTGAALVGAGPTR
jgi:hypothetical protein